MNQIYDEYNFGWPDQICDCEAEAAGSITMKPRRKEHVLVRVQVVAQGRSLFRPSQRTDALVITWRNDGVD